MVNLYWISEQNHEDEKWLLMWLVICAILFIWKEIAGFSTVLMVVMIVMLVIFCWVLNYIKKKRKNNPVSLWRAYQKKYPIIIQYAPPKWINSAEAWLLYNRKVDITDLTSLIYQWKFEWFIDIMTFKWENSKREYIKLVKKDELPVTCPLFEYEIFSSIFAMWNIKIIEWAFQLRYALMLEDLELHWIRKWWIIKSSWNNLECVYKILIVLLVAVFLVCILGGIFVPVYVFRIFLFSLLLFSCIFLWWYLDKGSDLEFTDKWAKIASQLIGYRNFIKSCDENKIKLLLKEDSLFIDRTLPYATAFWMETEFLKKISPLANDWNVKYLRWKKVPSWVSILRFFFKSDDDSLL